VKIVMGMDRERSQGGKVVWSLSSLGGLSATLFIRDRKNEEKEGLLTIITNRPYQESGNQLWFRGLF